MRYSIPTDLYLVIMCIHEAGLTFISAYGMNMTCIPFSTLASTACHNPVSRLKSSTHTMCSPSV